MNKILTDVYVQKSFWMLGKSLKKCYGCDYCRLDRICREDVEYSVLPTDVNSAFLKFPVAVNLFYGDPTLQVENTLGIIEKLSKADHRGPVVIITKGRCSELDGISDFKKLDVHFGLSVIGPRGEFNKKQHELLKENHLWCVANGFKHSVELRPIINAVNDGNTIDYILKICGELKLSVGYSGLQAIPEAREAWAKRGIIYNPYPGQTFGYQKQISSDVQNRIETLAEKYNVNIFSKTGCLISATHDYGRDYNAHYLKETEVNCCKCSYHQTCLRNKLSDAHLESILPYPHYVSDDKKYACHHAKMRSCVAITQSCFKMNARVVHATVPINTADVRLTKWLTGLTVDGDIAQSYHPSDFWMKN